MKVQLRACGARSVAMLVSGDSYGRIGHAAGLLGAQTWFDIFGTPTLAVEDCPGVVLAHAPVTPPGPQAPWEDGAIYSMRFTNLTLTQKEIFLFLYSVAPAEFGERVAIHFQNPLPLCPGSICWRIASDPWGVGVLRHVQPRSAGVGNGSPGANRPVTTGVRGSTIGEHSSFAGHPKLNDF